MYIFVCEYYLRCFPLFIVGECTTRLLEQISTPAHRPAYITGPYLSPFSSTAMDCENQIVIGSGIGITPAISIFRQYADTTRRINVVSMCTSYTHFLMS